MLTAERHREILRLLEQKGSITVAEIAHHFEISAATARRDAVILTEAGKAARSHGGLLPAAFFRGQASAKDAAPKPMGAAHRIARRSTDLIPYEGNVFIDASAIALETGKLLCERPDLRIFTNSISLIGLAPKAQATLTGIGGETQKDSLSLAGPLARAWLAHMQFDVAVIGAAGLDLGTGTYAVDAAQGTIQAEVMKRATVRILVADAAKWNRTTAFRLAPWGAFTSFVTDLDLAQEARVSLAAGKLKLYFV